MTNSEEMYKVMLKDHPDLLMPVEVAKILKTSNKTVYKMIHDGYIFSVRIGRSFRVPKIKLIEYLTGTGA